MHYGRHKAREYAIQGLYQLEIHQNHNTERLADFWEQLDTSDDAREFAQHLVEGTTEHIDAIDEIITTHTENWRLERLAILVRNLLRMAIFEMNFEKKTPYQIVIDETLEMAKDFVDESSVGFINSVLQKVCDSSKDAS